MAMTADSSHESPRSFDGVHSPQNRKSLSSPWAQVVRGEPESTYTAVVNQVALPPGPPMSPAPAASGSTPEQCSSIEISVAAAVAADGGEGNDENAGRPKKVAWKKPVNGVTDVSPVMGADAWPALSKSPKFRPKSSPSADSSSKIVLPDGPMPSSKGPVTPHSPQKQASSSAKSNATSNHGAPVRQRSMKRGGGGSGSGGGHTQSNFFHTPPPMPPPPPPYPLFTVPPEGYVNVVPPMPDQSPRESSYRGNTLEPRPVGGFVPPPTAVNDNRHSSRRGNFGPRGDGPHHSNFVGRRDQDRGHYGNVRDVPAPPLRSPRGFGGPLSPNTATFVAPQPMGYPGPDVVYIPGLPMEPFRGIPFITHAPPPMVIPLSEPPPLPVALLHQISYYFSDENLIRDEFLKSHMDDQGWVPVSLIAGFNRVRSMTSDYQFILDTIMTSSNLELQDEKVRRHDWFNWLPSRHPVEFKSEASSHDMLTNSLENLMVNEAAANQNSSEVESSKKADEVAVAHLERSEDASLS